MTNIETATLEFEERYERSADTADMKQERVTSAREVYRRMTGKEPTT